MLEEVKERERQADAQVKAKQQALEKARIDTEVQRLSAGLTELQGKASALRQVSSHILIPLKAQTRCKAGAA